MKNINKQWLLLSFCLITLISFFCLVGKISAETIDSIRLSEIDGKKYYINDDGSRYKGFLSIDDKIYFFSYANGLTKTGWQTMDGVNYFYCNNDGTIAIGFKTIDGKTYYFNSEGMLQKGFYRINDTLYFSSYANGAIKNAGWQTINGKDYFYTYADGTVAEGFKEIDGKTYYFNSEGMLQKGFYKIDDVVYFSSYANGAIKKEGWQSADGKNYFYTYVDGKVAVGFTTINEKVYYFSIVNYYLKKEGWQSADGKNYFYTYADGTVAQGFSKIKGSIYHFDSSTYYLSEMGWHVTNDDHKFYIKEDNKVAIGFQKIDDKIYYFGSVNYYLKKEGFQSLDGKNIFYTFSDGSVATGFQTINNTLYYFSIGNYYLKHGWQTLDGQNYFYCDDSGIVAVGNTSVEGRNYLFSDQGILQGFENINGKTYYHNPDGSLAIGVQRIAGKYWLFDSDGAFQSLVNQINVIDVSVHQGRIDWNKVVSSGQVDGVILRVGFGSILDSKFSEYISEIKRLQIPYGIYLFSYALNYGDAVDEANFTNEMITKYGLHPTLGVFYDLESWEYLDKSHFSIEQTVSDLNYVRNFYDTIAKIYIDTVSDYIKRNYRVTIYSGPHFIDNYFGSYAKNNVGWVAQWNSVCTYQGYYYGWQYTNSGTVDGISTAVDMSKFYF